VDAEVRGKKDIISQYGFIRRHEYIECPIQIHTGLKSTAKIPMERFNSNSLFHKKIDGSPVSRHVEHACVKT
jgi:hypothetical protein